MYTATQSPQVYSLVDALTPISLDDMDGVKLQDRIDSKYVIPVKSLPLIFKHLQNRYSVLDIDGRRAFNYVTTYFDTTDFQFYRDHHNRLPGRIKVRSRTYTESNLHFFEIKTKTNLRTKKYREKLAQIHTALSDKQCEKVNSFYRKVRPFRSKDVSSTLAPALVNTYTRITLVNNARTERCTIDLNLAFRNPSGSDEVIRMHDFAIIELKQSKASLTNGIAASLRELHIPPSSISKYVVGLIRIHPEIKHNYFKPLLHKLENISK